MSNERALLEDKCRELEEKCKSLEAQVEAERAAKNVAYSTRSDIAQLLVCMGVRHGFPGGIRTVGEQDPEWPVYALELSRPGGSREIAFHIHRDDVIYPDAPKYEVPWEFEERLKTATEEERSHIYKLDAEQRRRNIIGYITGR